KSKEIHERQASGIDVEDESEVDQGLRDIQEQLDDSERIRNEECTAKKQKFHSIGCYYGLEFYPMNPFMPIIELSLSMLRSTNRANSPIYKSPTIR
ncbi:MAG: hypothetical protein AAFY76_17675, partial [Cyanobacteria bacterium J06649_11]